MNSLTLFGFGENHWLFWDAAPIEISRPPELKFWQ